MSEEDEDMSLFSRENKYEEGDYYMGENGYIVFTEQFLLKRGYCCESGCRHCPYGYAKQKK